MADNDKLSILVVEDNEMFRHLSVEMLNDHITNIAKTGEEGISRFKKYSPDITFLDIGLPEKNGHEVLKEIREISQDAFVVMLTASSLKSDVQASLDLGANGYIVKPFSRKQVKQYINKYYEHIGSSKHEV